MIRPMPFCPSFEPCANDTPVQVRTSRPRIQNGGGLLPSGALYSAGIAHHGLQRRAAAARQHEADERREQQRLADARAPGPSRRRSCRAARAISWFISPTPMIEPISVCELDAGSPSYQVPRFQMIAAISSANTIAKPGAAADLQDQLDRQQRDDAERDRAARDQHAEEVPAARPDDREMRRQRVRVDHGGDRVRGVVETVDELEAERDQQRDAEQHEGADGEVCSPDWPMSLEMLNAIRSARARAPAGRRHSRTAGYVRRSPECSRRTKQVDS